MAIFIERLRKEHNFSQDYLANQIGVSRPIFALIEKDKKDLTITQARELAEIFGLSLTNFLERRIPKEPEVVIEKSKKKREKEESVMRISIPEENIEKFKEVFLYVLSKVGAKSNVGEGVLCKLLYFIDFDFYERYEKQLMGAVYIKNHHGPTPAGFPKIIEEMTANEEITRVIKKIYQYDQKKYIPLRKPDLSLISAEEIEHIDWVLARLSNKNSTEMKEYSHRDVPWISAEDQSAIDYETVFYRTPEYSVRSYDD